jgi:hypothetical protein
MNNPGLIPHQAASLRQARHSDGTPDGARKFLEPST